MTVMDLIAELSCLPEDAKVILASDEEGNSYHACSFGVEENIFDDERYVFLYPTGYEIDFDF